MLRWLSLVLAGLGACAFAQELDFLHGLDEYENIRRMLPDYMQRRAEALVQKRKQTLSIRDKNDLDHRRQFVREQILKAIGGLPERTPLNARTVATLERDGYRIEKVVFESQPQFYVTANLYLPAARQPPFPAVLYPLGHELGAKAHEAWQQMLATLARRGYVALTWDTIGQGERIQLYSADLHDSYLRGSTTEHTILGTQALLTGQHIARYTIWDGIRALDYLLSRKEVDPARVAVTGNSGGGTHTAYLAALDDRLKAAAPSCFITSWHWMLKTIGPQDAEQVFPGWLGNGLDYPDFIYAASPKPYLMLTAIRDFFPIDGARETFQEVRAVPGIDIGMFEADDGHGYTHPRRMAAYDWLSRKLRDKPDEEPEVPIEPESPETLNCTTTGQVVTSLGGETVSTLNRARAAALRANRGKPASAGDLRSWQDKVRATAQRLSGYEPASGPLSVTPYGEIAGEGYRIRKIVYESEPGILIPALMYIPKSGPARRPAVLIADGNGKSAAAKAAEPLAKAGTVVLSVDPRGMGETLITPDLNDSESYRYFGDYEDAMSAILMNRTLVAMRARDIVRGLDVLSAQPEVDAARLSGIGRHGAAVPLLYAAVFDSRLKSISLEDMPPSYDAVATTAMQRKVFEDIVPGALLEFDLPDLVGAIAPRPVWISNPITPTGTPLAQSALAAEYGNASKAFALAGVSEALRLLPPRPLDARSADYYHDLIAR
jgi:cephalosporin-C deacetylase-like acetyl esterase